MHFSKKCYNGCDLTLHFTYSMGEEQNRKDVTNMDDTEIIDLFWTRDQEAIRQTDKAYGRKLHVLSDRILCNREDARECVNDTYFKTWQIIPPQRPAHFYAFLASICRHLSFHRLDWRMAAKRNAEIISLTSEMELCISDTAQERELEGKELGRVMNEFLEGLPKESRLIFLRRYWHLDTVAEIAARYGMTESKVKMQLSRTRAKLRTHLEGEGIRV